MPSSYAVVRARSNAFSRSLPYAPLLTRPPRVLKLLPVPLARRKKTSETVTAIYEKGVLRLLTPLELPESTRVHLQIIDQTPADQEQHQVRQALLEAGLIRPRAASEPVEPVSEAQLAQAARTLAKPGPLSDLIISERNGR